MIKAYIIVILVGLISLLIPNIMEIKENGIFWLAGYIAGGICLFVSYKYAKRK